jgi:type II secretion system protein E
LEIDTAAVEKVPVKFACHYKIMPVKFEDNNLTIAAADPFNFEILDDLRLFLNCEVDAVLFSESDILSAIREYYGIGAETIDEISAGSDIPERLSLNAVLTENIEDMAEDASIIKFVNQVISQAVRDNATDIHIEPYEDEITIRYRIDGILYDMPIPKNIGHFHSAIVSRIKIMANLDISERRLPQDGRIKIGMSGEYLDLRISVLPTRFGESVDIRLLSSGMLYSLENLGLSVTDLTILEKLIRKPHGIVFVTGPTGSGKTTTLYSCLSKINLKDKKIITIEDPVEYQLRGITQLQVNPRIDLSFSRGLRSMLRHDPDIMMVGEVRDPETAGITIRAALTGHLVFSTLHTNDAAGGIARLLEMGIEPYLIASSIECFIAQRLVRLICPRCKKEKKADEKTLKDFGAEENAAEITVYEGEGCEFCKFSGYKGRTGLYEFLVMDEHIRDMVLLSPSSDRIKKKALERGMRTLRADGWEKIKRGLTTVSEVLRVTKED